MTYYLISQQTIANLLNTLPTEDSTKLAEFIQGRMKMEFENPTAIREVVRCKDCKWYQPDADKWCGYFECMGFEPDDYCSQGERKDGKGN